MAGKLNVAGAGLALDGAMGRVTVTPRTVYLALLTSIPGNTVTPASMSEYVATGYARQVIAMSVPAGTPRVTSNTATITFGPITGANNTTIVNGWAIISSASGATGEIVAQGDLNVTRTPAANDQLTVTPGSVTVQID